MTCNIKVYDVKSRRYRSGRTVNVSAGGALLDIPTGLYAGVGDELQLAIDWTGATPLMAAGDMIPVVVTRHLEPTATGNLVGVRFAGAEGLPLAA
jgi:hypothetical protein